MKLPEPGNQFSPVQNAGVLVEVRSEHKRCGSGSGSGISEMSPLLTGVHSFRPGGHVHALPRLSFPEFFLWGLGYFLMVSPSV